MTVDIPDDIVPLVFESKDDIARVLAAMSMHGTFVAYVESTLDLFSRIAPRSAVDRAHVEVLRALGAELLDISRRIP